MTQTCFFFPLRTNVEFFHSEKSFLDLKARVKQALILYDKVIFQAGVYQCSIGPQGSLESIQPFNPENQDDYRFSDSNSSTNFSLRLRSSDAQPGTPFTTIFNSPLQRYYRAEFHVLFSEMTSQGISGAEMFPITMTAKSTNWAKRAAMNDLKKITFPDDEPFAGKVILQNLNLDLLLITDLGWPASLDPLHVPFLNHISAAGFNTQDVPGFLSLNLPFPYVGDLSWEQISEFRNDPAVIEFRKKLVEIELSARTLLPNAPESEIHHKISQIVIGELLNEIKSKRQTMKGVAQNYIKDIALEIVGSVFPPAALVEVGLAYVDASKQILNIDREEKSWITAFMKLQQYEV